MQGMASVQRRGFPAHIERMLEDRLRICQSQIGILENRKKCFARRTWETGLLHRVSAFRFFCPFSPFLHFVVGVSVCPWNGIYSVRELAQNDGPNDPTATIFAVIAPSRTFHFFR